MNKFPENKRIILFAFLLIFFAVISIISFHYHKNGEMQRACPLCNYQIYGNDFINETAANSVISTLKTSDILPQLNTGFPENITIPAVYIHAPPVIS